MSSEIIHEEITFQLTDWRASAAGAQWRLRATRADDGHAVDLDGSVTGSAIQMLGAQSPGAFTLEQVRRLSFTLPNDGRRLENLELNAPIQLNSGHVDR